MKLYNTLSRRIEEFSPLHGKKVNLFVCGPTVYDLSHLGHAKTYIQMDVLARVLRAQDYEVFYLQNITDVDDKIITRAHEKNLDWKDLRSEFESKYLEDMDCLGNTSVTEYARATDYIADIIRQIQILIAKGNAYTIDDGIYFEISTFPGYGKLSGRKDVTENDAQTRIDQSDQKRGWNDFCLWKFSKLGEPVWDAPFGKGRPGWHIEDTAITEHFFGQQYDIHGGAVDLIFPHHEAELTQMEAISGKTPFVKYWTHTGFLNINDSKMAKSSGNFLTIRDVLSKGYDPMAIRLFMFQSHYRSSMNFSWELLDSAQIRYKNLQAMADLRWQLVHESASASNRLVIGNITKSIMQALQDDLNTPKALALLSKLEEHTNDGITKEAEKTFVDCLSLIDSTLGLNLLASQDITKNQRALLKQRHDARINKDWEASDKLRDDLHEQGIGIRDSTHRLIWYRL